MKDTRLESRRKGSNSYHLCVRYFFHRLSYLFLSIILCCGEILVMWKWRLQNGVSRSHKAGKRTELSLAATPGPCSFLSPSSAPPTAPCTEKAHRCTGRHPVTVSATPSSPSFCPSELWPSAQAQGTLHL